MAEKREGLRGILHGEIELHFAVILQAEAEIAVFDKIVAAVFVEAEEGNLLQTVGVEPGAGGLPGDEGAAGDDSVDSATRGFNFRQFRHEPV